MEPIIKQSVALRSVELIRALDSLNGSALSSAGRWVIWWEGDMNMIDSQVGPSCSPAEHTAACHCLHSSIWQLLMQSPLVCCTGFHLNGICTPYFDLKTSGAPSSGLRGSAPFLIVSTLLVFSAGNWQVLNSFRPGLSFPDISLSFRQMGHLSFCGKQPLSTGAFTSSSVEVAFSETGSRRCLDVFLRDRHIEILSWDDP